jgi:hypothetical protein
VRVVAAGLEEMEVTSRVDSVRKENSGAMVCATGLDNELPSDVAESAVAVPVAVVFEVLDGKLMISVEPTLAEEVEMT